MGVIRGILLILVCILIFISLLLTGVFATLNFSLDYDNVKIHFNSLKKETLQKQGDLNFVNLNKNSLEKYCNSTNNTQYVFNEEKINHVFTIPCDVVLQGSEKIIDYEIDILVNETYYKTYECQFWRCFKETGAPFFLISKYAQDYWKSNYFNLLIISIFLIILLFFLVENKTNFPILTGILLGIAFLPIAKLDTIGAWIVELLLSFVKNAISGLGVINLSSFSLIFFGKSNDVFLTGFIFGLVLIGIGIIIKLFKIGFKIENWISKFKNKKKENKNIEEIKEKKDVENVKENKIQLNSKRNQNAKSKKNKKGEFFNREFSF